MCAKLRNQRSEWDDPRSAQDATDDRLQRDGYRHRQDHWGSVISRHYEHTSPSAWGHGTRMPTRDARDAYHSPSAASQTQSRVRYIGEIHARVREHSGELRQERQSRNRQPSRPFEEVTASSRNQGGDLEYWRSRGLRDPRRTPIGRESQEDARGPSRWGAPRARVEEADMCSMGTWDMPESSRGLSRTSTSPGRYGSPPRFRDGSHEETSFSVCDPEYEAHRSRDSDCLDHDSHSYPHADGDLDTTDFTEPSQRQYRDGRDARPCWGSMYGRGSYRATFSQQTEYEEPMDMLPSHVDRFQGTLRFRGSLRGRWNPPDDMTEAGHPPDGKEDPMTGSEIVETLSCIREQPWPMERRRLTRMQLRKKLEDMEWRWFYVQPVTTVMKKGGHKITSIFQAFDPWHRVLKRIEGKFGTSVVAVFIFLRDLIQLNLVLALLLVGGVVVPSALWATDDTNQGFGWQASGDCFNRPKDLCSGLTLRNDPAVQGCNRNYVEHLESVVSNHRGKVTDLVQDFLQGTGFLEWTLLFSGFYPVTTDGDYLVSLAYILTVLLVYFISLIYVVVFAARFLRHTSGTGSEYGMIFSNIIFAGWDFTVSESAAVHTEHRLIVSEVKAAFDDEEFHEKKLKRTRNDLAQLYLARVLVNIFVLFLITGGWTGIYFLVKEAEKPVDDPFQQDLWSYAPTVCVALLNFIYPVIFNFVVTFEHYRGRTELLLTLGRCVLIRLTSLGILVITKLHLIYYQSRGCDPEGQDYICWETHLGQQVYSVLVLDVLIQIGMTFVINVSRKGLSHFENSLCKRASRIEFDVPGHVLDIVYVQAICWLGVLYSPLMATVCYFTFCILFGLKLFTLTWTCVPATRVFRASRSSAMFTTILLLAFLMCLMSNGWAMFFLCPSEACSPFRGLGNSWESLTYYICRINNSAYWIRSLLFTLDDAVVTIVLIGLVILLFTFYISVIKARNALIKRLEKKLRYTAKDKAYLVEVYKSIRRADAV
ncbi:transmembrane channel-like protein 7 isoform X2 [Panulirus ornatus]